MPPIEPEHIDEPDEPLGFWVATGSELCRWLAAAVAIVAIAVALEAAGIDEIHWLRLSAAALALGLTAAGLTWLGAWWRRQGLRWVRWPAGASAAAIITAFSPGAAMVAIAAAVALLGLFALLEQI